MSASPDNDRIPATPGRDSQNARHQDARSTQDPTPYDTFLSLVRDGMPDTGDAPRWEQVGAALRAVLESVGCDRGMTDAILAHAALAPYGNYADGKRMASYDIAVAAQRMGGYRVGESYAELPPGRKAAIRLRQNARVKKTESLARLTGIIAERTATERAIADGKADQA